MVELTGRLPYASLDLGTFPFWLLVLLYAALGTGIWSANRPRTEKEAQPRFHLPDLGTATTRMWVGGMSVGALLVWLAVLSLPDGRLHVAFLDVGQGDAILITTPEGRQILVDGGPTATDLTWRLGQEMPFWDHSLDMVVNTHPDADHLAGLPPLLDRYQVDNVLVTDMAGDSNLYREWETQLGEAQLNPTIGQAGMQLTLGRGVTATLLTPGPATAREDETNNHSVVMRLQMGRISFLLTGDIEASVERNLVSERASLAVTVLKSPHHGSKTSSTEAFLKAINPQIVVISVGQDNDYGHPSPEVLDRYAEHGFIVFRTDEQGTVEFSTDGEQLWVETSR
jgi:competence protein ComEC